MDEQVNAVLLEEHRGLDYKDALKKWAVVVTPSKPLNTGFCLYVSIKKERLIFVCVCEREMTIWLHDHCN